MTPPREYFELVIKPDFNKGYKCAPGEQKVGFNIYRFVDEFVLARMIEDGFFSENPSRIEELEIRILNLQEALKLANEKIQLLKKSNEKQAP